MHVASPCMYVLSCIAVIFFVGILAILRVSYTFSIQQFMVVGNVILAAQPVKSEDSNAVHDCNVFIYSCKMADHQESNDYL